MNKALRTVMISTACLALVVIGSVSIIHRASLGGASHHSSTLQAVAQTPTPPFHWAMASGLNVGAGDNFLASIGGIQDDDIWATGNYLDSASGAHRTLMEHWNGSAWSVIPSPNPGKGGDFLAGISVVNAHLAWAVGQYQNNPIDDEQALIEQWNGKAWSVVPSPNTGGPVKFLFGVAAVDATTAWAVGFDTAQDSSIAHTLIEQWNGQVWTVVPSPNSGTGSNVLYGIAASSANDAWAVGDDKVSATGVVDTLIEHWDGRSWSVVPSPNLPNGNSILAGITTVDANTAWAVGYAADSATTLSQTLVERWNGQSWSLMPSPNPGMQDNELYGIHALNARNIWSVGNYQDDAGNLQSLIERWDGKAWSVEPSPNPGSTGNSLDGITVIDAQHIWAVGEYRSGAPFQTFFVTREHQTPALALGAADKGSRAGRG
jgi:hypothetical protein